MYVILFSQRLSFVLDLFGKENNSNKPNSSIYKALVPNKLTRRPSRDALKLNVGSGARDVNSNCSSKSSTPTHTPSPTANKTSSRDANQAIPNGGLSPVNAKEVRNALGNFCLSIRFWFESSVMQLSRTR